MKFILSVLLLILVTWITWVTTANTKLEVYKQMLDQNVLTWSDIREIDQKLSLEHDCTTKANWYITLTMWGIVWIDIIHIKYCTQKEYRYLLLHEIWHRVYNRYKKPIPLKITDYAKKYTGEIYLEEVYAESFTHNYY